MSLNIDISLTNSQIALLPFFTPFSIRHLKKPGWLNKIVGVIELFPGISALATGIELFIHHYFLTRHSSSPLTPDRLNQNISDDDSQVSNTSNRVVIVADKTIFMQHMTGKNFQGQDHPESPKRVEAIEEALREAGLMDPENTVRPRQATTEEITVCHDKSYQEELKRQINDLQVKRKQHASFNSKILTHDYLPDRAESNIPGDFEISPETLNVALYAAGAPLTSIEYILNKDNKTSRAFCIVRPPGHHAHQQTGSGFCVFNNVAIAAKHLTQNLGFQRVLIVDWDAHHGDGTQELTEDDEKIFYFSTHKDTINGFYPGTHWGRADQKGVGKGKGTVLNCPVQGSKEECRMGILKAFREQLVPAMEIYKPDFVLISCGFDAHEKDPLVGLGLKDEDYAELTSIVIDIAKGAPIVSILEGGYNLDAIAEVAKVHVETLMRI
jgi:acetoin utilization deacetylase AcuC-like enzyme